MATAPVGAAAGVPSGEGDVHPFSSGKLWAPHYSVSVLVTLQAVTETECAGLPSLTKRDGDTEASAIASPTL